MTVAQGINKIVSIKAQGSLGSPASGAGAQTLRRKTSVSTRKRATYVNDEIVTHQQSTGVNLGTASTDWAFDGLLSPLTYQLPIQGLMRKAFAATTALTAVSATISVSGSLYVITVATGSFLSAGMKIGDVVRITSGTYANAVNRDNNLLITTLSATVAAGVTVNGSVMIAEGPISASGITVTGKKVIVPTSGHLDTLYTVEEWYADLTRSELYPDIRIGQIDIGLPASGNATIKISAMGLGTRTLSGSQVLTTPTAATTSAVLTAVRGVLVANGSAISTCTGASITIKGNLTAEGPVVGSNVSPDMSRGRIEVSGQFTGLFDAATLQTLYDAETLTTLVCVMACDSTNNSDFMTFSMSAIKLTGDNPDDGEKAIIRTYPFTAQINAAGSAVLANDNTIISIQDSLAA